MIKVNSSNNNSSESSLDCESKQIALIKKDEQDQEKNITFSNSNNDLNNSINDNNNNYYKDKDNDKHYNNNSDDFYCYCNNSISIPEIKNYFDDENKKTKSSADKLKMLLLAFNASLGFFFIGYHITSLNIIEYYIPLALHWNFESKTSLFSACSCIVPLGALFGSIISGKTASGIIGRKNSLILFNFIGIIGSLITLIPITIVFIIGRFIVGFAAGGFSTLVPLYIKEFIPAINSGKFGMVYFLFYDISVLTAFLLGFFLPDLGDIKEFYDKNTFSRYGDSEINEFWWRFIMIFPSFLSVLNIFLYLKFFNHDTPEYLVSQRHEFKSAENALKLLYTNEAEIQLLVKKIKSFHESTLNAESNLRFKDLLAKKYRLRLIIGLALNIGQQATAINVYPFYSQLIYLKKEPLIEPSIYSFYFCVAEIIGTSIAIFIIEKTGRRKLLLLGLFSIFICLSAITFFYFINVCYLHKFIVIFYYFFAGVSVDPLVWIINADLLPDIGIGLCATANWISTIIVIICFPYMLESFLYLEGTFLVFTVFTFALFLFVFLFFKETHNKTHKELTLAYSKWF